MVRAGVVLNKTPGSKMYGTAHKQVGLFRAQESQYIGAMFLSCRADLYCMEDKDEYKSINTAAPIFAHPDIEEI